MGQTLKEFSDSITWDFHMNPAEMGKYLKEKRCDDSN